LIHLLERHARSIVVIALALTAAGLFAAYNLPVGLFPQVSFPRVVIGLDAGDRPADQTAIQLTRPVEEAVRSVPGVRNVRSETTRGSAQVSIDFGWGRDMVASMLLVDAAITRVLPSLPPGTSFDVRRMDPTVFPIIAYALRSETLSPVALRDLAQFRLVPLLSSIPGLARVSVQGGATAEIEVQADPHKLDAFGLGLADLVSALSAANVLKAVGRVQDHDKLYLVVSDQTLRTLDRLRNIVVRSDPAGLVRLRDVAAVSDGVVPQWVQITADGRPAVLFNVYEQPDGNVVQIAAAVRDKLAAFQLPDGVTLASWYDQSELVTQSAGSVRDAVLIGLVLAAGVLLVFLRNWRLTLIAVLVVPATLAITMLLLSLLGMSFNIMTLGGIAAAVGLLIDDVIVMVEHIARRAGVRDNAARPAGSSAAVLPAAREFLRPLSGSSLATLIVFVPLSFLGGVTGAFSQALSLTMGCALAVSYLMTAFVVPVLARILVNFDTWQDRHAEQAGWFAQVHTWLLDGILRRPWLLAPVLLPLAVMGFYASRNVATGFMPAVDEGGFVLDYFTAPGTSLIESAREIAQVEEILKAMPEIATFSRRLGATLSGNLTQSYRGDFFVRLKPDHARSTPDVMAAVTQRVKEQVPGVTIELAQLMEDLIGDLTAVPQPIEVKLTGAASAALNQDAVKVAAAIREIPGVTGVKDGVNLAGDAIDVRVDPVKAAFEGVSADQVTQAVATALTGTVATQIPEANKAVGVRVLMPGAREARIPDLEHLAIRAPAGPMLPLRRVATVTPVSGQPQISRENLQPMVAVTGRIEGRDLGGTIADVRQVLSKPGLLSSGVSYELGGLYAQQQIAFLGLAKVFAAALIAELVLLLFLYEQFWLPVIIAACSLLSTAAVFIGLWISGVELNITALMGMTMVIGIGTEIAIFYVSEYTELAGSLEPRRALREAARNRLRPISMTTLAALLTLSPLALAIGQGSAIQQPLAIAIIAGLLLQYPLVLLGMPALIGLTLPRSRKQAG
jgi:multidrug efflux pump subunit AcrB